MRVLHIYSALCTCFLFPLPGLIYDCSTGSFRGSRRQFEQNLNVDLSFCASTLKLSELELDILRGGPEPMLDLPGGLMLVVDCHWSRYHVVPRQNNYQQRCTSDLQDLNYVDHYYLVFARARIAFQPITKAIYT